MTTAYIHRVIKDETGTFGTCMVPNGGVWATAEAPWISGDGHPLGVPFESCLPDGRYHLVWHRSPRYGRRLHIVDPTRGLFLEDTPDALRFACLIHPGNEASDFIGCMGLGPAYQPAANPTARRRIAWPSRVSVLNFQRFFAQGQTHRIHIETPTHNYINTWP